MCWEPNVLAAYRVSTLATKKELNHIMAEVHMQFIVTLGANSDFALTNFAYLASCAV